MKYLYFKNILFTCTTVYFLIAFNSLLVSSDVQKHISIVPREGMLIAADHIFTTLPSDVLCTLIQLCDKASLLALRSTSKTMKQLFLIDAEQRLEHELSRIKRTDGDRRFIFDLSVSSNQQFTCQQAQKLHWLFTMDLLENKIQSLKLKNANPVGATLFFKDLAVTHLCLCHNYLNLELVQAMSNWLKTNATTTELDLDTCYIGGQGAQLLAESLVHNITLTTLQLSCNEIDVVGTRALAYMLKNNTTLKQLNLDYNSEGKFGAAGAQELAEGLKYNSTLTRLDLCGNFIRDEGGRAFARMLPINSTLTYLDIGCNLLSDEVALLLRKVKKPTLDLWLH